jgi:hypothetical protein
MNELGVERFQPGRTWLLSDASPPCPLRERVLKRRLVCNGEFCENHVVDYAAGLTFSCPMDDENGEFIIRLHSIVVLGNEPTRCRLSRLVHVNDAELDRTSLPPPVRAALAVAEGRPGRSVDLRVGHAGTLPSIWQIDSFDADALNRGTGNCPRPIWVFVRTPSGVVQLDVSDQVDGILSEADSPKVVLVGPYARQSKAFDVARLPPHVIGTMSSSLEGCMH